MFSAAGFQRVRRWTLASLSAATTVHGFRTSPGQMFQPTPPEALKSITSCPKPGGARLFNSVLWASRRA